MYICRWQMDDEVLPAKHHPFQQTWSILTLVGVSYENQNSRVTLKEQACFIHKSTIFLGSGSAHFQRLRPLWGFHLIRFSVTWEAVMHECPGYLLI